jgi:hypothetical protein
MTEESKGTLRLGVNPADVSINEAGHVVVKNPALAAEVQKYMANPGSEIFDNACTVNAGQCNG